MERASAKPARLLHIKTIFYYVLCRCRREEFNALTDVADFSLLAAKAWPSLLIMEPNGSSIPGASDPVIQLVCLDSSGDRTSLQAIFSVILSGTLSPIDLYPKLLQI
jgi:DNA excision repair protein ERCC-2